MIDLQKQGCAMVWRIGERNRAFRSRLLWQTGGRMPRARWPLLSARRVSERKGEFGRIAVNVDTVYRHLDPAYASPNVVEQFRRMAVLEAGEPESLR